MPALFLIGHDQMGPRIGISTAAIFTLIAFQFSLGRVLPPISYLTRANEFARRVDRHSRWVYPTLFLVVVVVTLVA